MRAMDRRGLSPLIATVLLMAFAVALGGMIMNWKYNPSTQAESICSKIEVEVGQLCYQDNAIVVNARSVGETPVLSLLLDIDIPGVGHFPSVRLPDSGLGKGQSLSRNVPFVVNEASTVSLVAEVGERASASTTCPDPIERRSPLPKC